MEEELVEFIAEDIRREAAVNVHKCFGTSKRFSEGDKREMSEMLALKLQSFQNSWTERTREMREKLEEQRLTIEGHDQRVKTIDHSLINFIKKRKSQLEPPSHDMNSTTEILASSVPDLDFLAQLDRRLRLFFDRMHILLEERHLMLAERTECVRRAGLLDKNLPENPSLVTVNGVLEKAVKNRQLQQKQIHELKALLQVAELAKCEGLAQIGRFREREAEGQLELKELRESCERLESSVQQLQKLETKPESTRRQQRPTTAGRPKTANERIGLTLGKRNIALHQH